MKPFQKIPEACKTTGLSQYFLRQGCKNGTIPHVKSGTVYFIDVPALLEKLRGDGNGYPMRCATCSAWQSRTDTADNTGAGRWALRTEEDTEANSRGKPGSMQQGRRVCLSFVPLRK